MFACNRVCNHNERDSLSPEVSPRKHEGEAIRANPSASPEKKSSRGTLIDMGLYSLNYIITNAMDELDPNAPLNGPVTYGGEPR